MNRASDQDSSVEFVRAVETSNLDYFKQHVRHAWGPWRNIRTESGNTLLHETILQKKRQIFKHMLEFCDEAYLEILNRDGQTAMTLAMGNERNCRSLYVPDLVKKFNTIPSQYDGILLHWAIDNCATDMVEYLLKKGINPNIRKIKYGPTPLHKAVQIPYINYSNQYITTLLLSGADPFLKFQKLYAFEMAVLLRRRPELYELLFDYTFDKHQKYKINFKVLLELAIHKSPLFHRILKYKVDFVVDEVPSIYCGHNVELLFTLDLEYLKIVLKKQYSRVCDSFRFFRRWDSIWNYTMFENQDPKFVDQLNMFIESGATMRKNIVSLMPDISSRDLFNRVVKLGECKATQVITFMSQYGLEIPKEAFELVYKAYGYCDLFKFLLRVEYVENYQRSRDIIIIVSLIRDIHEDLQSVCLRRTEYYSGEKLLDVLDFFAHKKLNQFLWKKIRKDNLKFPESDLERLRKHPQVPCLVELARNAFRKNLVERFRVECTRRFFHLVGNLDISLTYKKIICFETRLY